MNAHEAKTFLRRQIAARRDELMGVERRVKEAAINERLLRLLEDRRNVGRQPATVMT